jgi:hypothetical protein
MGKSIAIFADGTGNTVGKHATNVLALRDTLQDPTLVIYVRSARLGHRSS